MVPMFNHRHGRSIVGVMVGTASRRPNELGRVTADLVVLTVLREEYEAVLGCLAAPGLLLGSEGAPNTYAWQLGSIESPRYEATFRVVVGMGTPTTTYGALAAMQAIRLFDPRYIAFVGVAGGFDRDGQRHGDVAVSSAVVAYEYGKVDTGGFAPRGDFTYRCDDGLVRAAEAVASARWWRADESISQPRVRTGMIASGDKLIDDPEEALFAAVAKMWPKLLAVEMEGAGVAAAVHEAQSLGHRARFVLVRGISDMPHTKVAGEGASTGERDSWKRAAARNAARFLAHLVAEAWPERPRGEVRAPSEGESADETEPAAVVASGLVPGGARPAVGGVMVSPVIGQTAPARWEPVHANAESSALSQRLKDAYGRRTRLLGAGAATDAVDREILELKRQLREGGRLRAGDSLDEGRYVLVEELGRGGFAVVWRAKDEVEERHVAIKVLHANLAGDAIRRERFYRGARAMQRLQHAGVVRVLEPEGEDGGFCYFVMELVSNGNLHDAVVGKRVPGDVALGHILRVGEALTEAHSQGMIHRDIKPQNILLDEVFEAKLTDFDLVGAKDTTGGTRTGAMGTAIYAAPECLERPQETTARVDVFGLGMTAIFCLAGKPLTLSTLRNAEPMIAGLPCSDAVKEVLRRAVDWDPAERYADAGAMVSALRGAMSADPGAKVVHGDAGSGAEAGSAVPSNVVSGTPTATSIVSPLPAVPDAPIASGAPMSPNPGAPSAGVSPFESVIPGAPRKRSSIARNIAIGVVIVLSVLGARRFEIVDKHAPADAARGARADGTQNPPWAMTGGTDRYGRWAAFEVNGVQQRMRWILPGKFDMGSPQNEVGRYENEAQHEVTLSRGYWLGETPVTQALWVAVMGENPSHFRGAQPEDLERPVEGVSWNDSQEFLERLNQWVGRLFARLPTEAEWERACRGGTMGATWVGELSGTERAPELDAIAWYGGNSNGKTHPVGRKRANPYGLYDMLGNVWEWCADVGSSELPEYRGLPDTDPVATGRGSYRVYRGGWWLSSARDVRAARRYASPREYRDDNLGFRLAVGQVSAPR